MDKFSTYTSKQVKILHEQYYRSLQVATNKSGKEERDNLGHEINKLMQPA
jgi:hypothetical protein